MSFLRTGLLVIVVGVIGYGVGATRIAPRPQPCTVAVASTKPGYSAVLVFLGCDEPVKLGGRAVPRQIPLTPSVQDRIAATLRELLRGPTREELAAGFESPFSERTAGMLNSVTLSKDGRAVVDFSQTLTGEIPQASTSFASLQLRWILNSTIFQFETVNEIVYQLDGSCEAFYGWFESECGVVTRSQWETQR